MTFRKRLALERIESGACNPVFAKSLNQRRFLHDRTSSRINEVRRRLHLPKFAFPEQTFGLVVQKTVDRNEVGRAKHSIKVRQFHPEFSGIIPARIWIVRKRSREAKRSRKTEHLRADVAEANRAQ